MGSLDFLYIALGVGFLLFMVFASVAIFYLIFILRDISRVTEAARDTSEKINEYILSPIKMANAVMERAKPIYDVIQDKFDKHIKSRSKKKR